MEGKVLKVKMSDLMDDYLTVNENIKTEIKNIDVVAIDFKTIDHIRSSEIGLILKLHKDFSNKKIALFNYNDLILDILKLTNVVDHFIMCQKESELNF